MWGVISLTTSPSVRSRSRSTPCVLGCWGPMLTSISSVRTSNSTTVGSSSCAIDIGYLVEGIRHRGRLPRADPVVLLGELVVLAQWIANPILRAENADQVWVAHKVHAGQVVNLSLMPIG